MEELWNNYHLFKDTDHSWAFEENFFETKRKPQEKTDSGFLTKLSLMFYKLFRSSTDQTNVRINQEYIP